MNATELLAHIRLATPCTARWEDMNGDERVRFCARCRKHVFNFARLTAEEAAGLVREKEGGLCARFYRRPDGTVLTADCPVGLADLRRRVRKVLTVAAAVAVAAVGWSALARNGGPSSPAAAPGALSRAWDDLTWSVRSWLGLIPVKAGGICASPPVPAPPATPAPAPVSSQ